MQAANCIRQCEALLNQAFKGKESYAAVCSAMNAQLDAGAGAYSDSACDDVLHLTLVPLSWVMACLQQLEAALLPAP